MRDSANSGDSIQGRIEHAKDRALGAHHSRTTHGDELAEAAGGITGVLVGAGLGSAAGPVGTLLGGVAGALAGWWSGRAVAEAASTLSRADDAHYREHYESRPDRPADRSYEDVRGAYFLGQIASHNPNYLRREFADVEPELERGWEPQAPRHGSWESMKDYVREGYTRGQSRLDERARDARRQGLDDDGGRPEP
jgi:hypothetical protein